MKMLFIFFSLILLWNYSLANGEYVAVGTPNGEQTDPAKIGYVPPCGSVIFIAHYSNPPGGYNIYKIQWYVNDQFVSNRPEFTWIVSSHTTRVYFKAFYLSSEGVESIGTSPNFNLLVQDLDFPTNIAISNNSPAYGCTDPISLSLPETPCTGSYCDLTFNVNGNYNMIGQVSSFQPISSLA